MTKANGLALSLAAAGLAIATTAASAATYNGDLIIGFTAGTGNDLLYDLGSPSSITDGQTWNLNSLLTTGGFDLTTVNWGVVGSQTVGANRFAWCSKVGSAPQSLNGNNAWSTKVNANVLAIYGQFPTAGAGQSAQTSSGGVNSWNQQTIASPSSGSFHIAYTNPNATGETNLNYYVIKADNSAATLLGHFSLGANGVVTFITNSVVTPPTPPVPQIVQVTRTNTTSTIYFSTTNNAAFIYNLYYTNNSAGLTAPVSNWTVSAGSVIGNGLTNSISDTSTDMFRFYSVGVH